MRSADRIALLVLFWISGFAGLVYESIWTQYVKLFVGQAAYAQALVLSIFMGGLTLGAWLASRSSRRWSNAFVAYAAVEAVLGVFALVFHEAFVGTTTLAYEAILPRLAGATAAAWAVKYGLSALLILPQSTLLGMTFPLMVGGLVRSAPERAGRSVASLYGTNSLGAAAGVLVSGFLLVPVLGLPGTVRLAGVLNLLVAAEVWRRFGRAPATHRSAPVVVPPRPVGPGVAFFLAVSLATGASSFVYEIAWIRMLSLVLGASTHAFELMLAAFILGLAIGGYAVQRRIDALRAPARTLALVQVAMGLFALATLPSYGELFPLMRWLLATLPRSDGGYALFNVSSAGIALAVMLPATICAGMTLPLITVSLLRRGSGEESVGYVYAANTVGAILAVVLAVAAMPLLGLKGLVVAGAAIDLGLGVVLAWRARPELSIRATAVLASGALAAVALTLGLVRLDPTRMASGVFREGKLLDEGDHVVLHRDGRSATVSVIAGGGSGQLRIATNGKVDGAITVMPGRLPASDESTMILLGAVPMALHPEARTAACIGFGSGLTTHVLLSNPRLEQVHTVEIEPEMVRAAERFRPVNELAYRDPRSRLHIDDAKSFFAGAGRRFDLVVSEPSNPWVSGVAGLFTHEFYGRVSRQLSDGGLFVQWIQLYEITPALFASVLKAIERNFDDYAVYATNSLDALVVARRGGRVGAPDPGILAVPGVAEPLRRIGIASLQDLEARKVGDRWSWEGLTRSYPIRVNSDYFPVLDLGAARARFLGAGARGLLAFARDTLPIVELSPSSRHARERTAITPTPFFDGTLRAARAAMLRDVVVARDPGLVARLPDGEREAAGEVVAWLERCGEGRPEPLPLTSFLLVARATLPELTPAELAAMWRPVVSGPCAASLAPEERGWVEVVSAVSARDGAAMAASARKVLETAGLPPDDVRFLVAAGLLGSLVQGDRVEAARLWQRYGAGIDARRDLLLRVLVARATSPELASAQ